MSKSEPEQRKSPAERPSGFHFKTRLFNRWRKTSPVTRWTVLAFIVVLVGARLALPFILKAYVNHRLEELPNYGGRVGDVDVHLWRGAYRLNDVVIVRKSGEIPTPFFAVPEMDLSIEWKEILHGAIVGEVHMQRPQVNFEVGPGVEQTQTGAEVGWDKILASLFPFKLNRLQIQDGRVHFRNPYSTPPVNIFVEQLSATATNFTNTRDLLQELPAGVTARGTTLGGGGFDLHVQVNPLEEAPTFEMTTQLTNVNMLAMNDCPSRGKSPKNPSVRRPGLPPGRELALVDLCNRGIRTRFSNC